MYSTVLIPKPTNPNKNKAIMISSHHNRHKKRSKHPEGLKRTEAEFSSKSYRDGLQRAFNRAKQQVYFNPDMKYFVTLTYEGSDHTIDDVMTDLKIFFKTERRKGNNPKYIWVAEYQKRGSIHVHMITNRGFETSVNQNGYDQLSNWHHGFSSVLHITDFDKNFKPYLYLFKYMKKAQRIGKSFIHSSRNISNFEEMNMDDFQHNDWNVYHQERTQAQIRDFTLNCYKYYLERDTIAPQQLNGG